MLKRLSGTVLVSAGEQGTEAPEARRVRYAVMRGRRVARRGECAMTELQRLGGWDVRASFFSRSGYFERTQAQTANKRLAAVVARRFIDGEMLFNESYRLRLAAQPTGEHEFTLRLMAAAEIDCMRLEEALPLTTRPVSLASLEETAIAALIAKVTAEPVLTLFARGERFISFVAENGEVRQRRMENIPAGDMEAAAAAAQRAEVMTGGSIGAGMGGQAAKEIVLRIYLGDLRPLTAEGAPARDYPSREVEKKMAAQIQGGDALAEPELYGLRFVQRVWNFLEDEQAHRAVAWHIALPAAGLLTAGGALLSLLFAIQLVSNSGEASQLERKRQDILAQRDALAKRTPKDKELASFKDLTELLKLRSEQVRVDRLLSWLSGQLPSGITIASVQVYGKGDTPPDTKQGKPADSGKEQDLLSKLLPGNSAAQDKPAPKANAKAVLEPGVYTMHLELTVPGTYDTVESQAAETIRRLSTKLVFEKSHLDYDASKNRAKLVSDITVHAEDFHQ